MISVTFRGNVYQVPEPNDSNNQALTDYLNALSTGAVPFPTNADIDLGVAFGIKALDFKTRAANPAASGLVRSALADVLAWRNNANNADLLLGVGAQDQLQWRGSDVTGNPMLGASTAAAQAISSGVTTIVVYGTVEVDTDSGYAAGTGRYTVPAGKGGHYLLTANIGVNGTPTNVLVAAYKAAAELKRLGHYAGATVPAATQVGGSAIVVLAAGDIIDIRVTGTGAWNLTPTAAENYFALKRIPA